ncbi:GNAT family N-acetyltransferase [Kribbella sp. NPDC023855]|uniref:GNAT family N-acetyltransferase n=1 Tax=Kribbella sp. NPDC023855 TaxID=3154698 RepID=UPI0033C0E6C5
MAAVRLATLDDAAALAGLYLALFPYLAKTEDQYRHDLVRTFDDPRRAAYAAESDSRMVGWAMVLPATWRNVPGAFNLHVFVHQDHRRAGLGSQLLAAVDAHLADHEATEVEATPDESGLTFALRNGYQAHAEMRYAGVDLRTLPPEPVLPDGVAIVPLADVDPEAAFAVYREAGLDIPSTPVDAPYEWFRQVVWDSPNVAWEYCAAAVDGDQVVCLTISLVGAGGLWTDMTATRRSHRGRGLARAVKWSVLRTAADAGLTSAFTANAGGNRPMLAVNEWLGYHQVAKHTVVSRNLRTS